ncbi:MAG: arginine--tRNA ligase [Patescibacteria group bacterium]|nr:arginine--tRNA ligase [bacterium]MDZ4241016.1 arginine--tRNA ligase [Patescibacteria group bacterium]
MKEKLERVIKEMLKKVGIKNPAKVTIERPADSSHGDYSTNVALTYCKDFSLSPHDLALKLASELERHKPEEVEKIEIAGPGFINFFLSKQFLADSVKEILKQKNSFGQNKTLSKEGVMVEYTDPNPFKEFHIGHLMSNTIGESISRLLEWNGAKVRRANYQGDVGIHVAKALWGKLKDPASSWGQTYAQGAKQYDENETAKKEIAELNKKIYARSDTEINKLYDQGKSESLKQFEKMYTRLGTRFDFFFFESSTGEFGKGIVQENTPGIFEKSDGAVVFKGEPYGLHTRVFLNSDGLPTYETKELGLAEIKYEKYAYTKSIVITGNEVNDYFKVLLKVLELISPDLASKTLHISHGMLRLPEGKMSSRTGNVITAESLIDEVREKVKEKVSDRDLTDGEKEIISEQVAVGAIKYSILKQASGKDIIFDFDKSLSFEGDSGPYLQYAHTRAKSILVKAREEGIKEDARKGNPGSLERLLVHFSEVVEHAGKEHEPHYVVTYLTELAGAFNSFYAKEKIVDSKDLASAYKVALTSAVAAVLKNGLTLLGIPAPDKM